MIDIHAHIIPGTDDGAVSMEESIEMAALAEEDGINTIIATPHYAESLFSNNCRTNQLLLEDLQFQIAKAGIKVQILLGNEISATPELPNLMRTKAVTSLNNSRYLLVELPFYSYPPYLEKLLFNLGLEGMIIILAHPERNMQIVENPSLLDRLIRLGAMVQINAASITGGHGKRAEETSILLLKHNMVHFIATDAHSTSGRIPNLSRAVEKMSYYCSEEELYRLVFYNPERLVKNETIHIPEPKEIKRRKGFFHI